jgi:hypothetical protein
MSLDEVDPDSLNRIDSAQPYYLRYIPGRIICQVLVSYKGASNKLGEDISLNFLDSENCILTQKTISCTIIQ